MPVIAPSLIAELPLASAIAITTWVFISISDSKATVVLVVVVSDWPWRSKEASRSRMRDPLLSGQKDVKGMKLMATRSGGVNEKAMEAWEPWSVGREELKSRIRESKSPETLNCNESKAT